MVQENKMCVCVHAWASPVLGGIESACKAGASGDARSIPVREDPREGMATHSSILAWRTPWTGGAWRVQSIGLHRVDTAEVP